MSGCTYFITLKDKSNIEQIIFFFITERLQFQIFKMNKVVIKLQIENVFIQVLTA